MDPQPERIASSVTLASYVRSAARQPELPTTVDGADCQRDWGLVLHAFDLHPAIAVDRTRRLCRAGIGAAGAAANFCRADGGSGERPSEAQARDDCRRPCALWSCAGNVVRAFAVDGVADLSVAAGGNHHGCFFRTGAQFGDSQHRQPRAKFWSPTLCRRRPGR